MDFRQIIKRDLLFYRRTNLTMALLAAVCCAVLTGAMLVGDSVQHTLRKMALMRLGEKTQWAVTTGDRFFRQELAGELERKTESLLITPVLALNGILESPDGSVRINNVNVYGVGNEFVQLAPPPGNYMNLAVPAFTFSQSVASRLESSGEYLLRIQSPSQLSNDMIFTTETASSQAWSVDIENSIPDDAMGRFSLQASQEPPLNVFVPIEWLVEKVGIAGKANMLLVGIDGANHTTEQELSAALKEAIQPEDLGLEIRKIEMEDVFELRTSRIFLDAPIADAAMKTGAGAYGVFTYFVNEIRSGDKAVPYSTVSAIDTEAGASILSGLKEDQIIINEWLANELDADEGDSIELTYFQLTPTRKLIEQTTAFTVKQVVPMMGSFADPTLMPDYPGLTEADSCSQWDSGISIDLDRIKQRDEAYWDKYKGTPKAFVSLKTAQTIWQNRFGTLTAVRWPVESNPEEQIRAGLMKNLDPAKVGFAFRDVREAARRSAVGSTDFAGLFAGLSMFLIFSAAILMALVFAFHVESRSQQVGLLLAIGWGWLKILGLFLLEGAVIAMVGCVLGAAVSVLYTYGLILTLNATFWARALANLQLDFHMNSGTLARGALVSFLICVFAIQGSLYHRIRRPAHQLLTGIFERSYKSPRKTRFSASGWLGGLCLFSGIAIAIVDQVNRAQVASFFVSGTLCLTGLILIAFHMLRWLRSKSLSFAYSINSLAMKSITRRAGRSLAVLITLACGVFMVIGVGANYKDVGADAQSRTSGTGGFALVAQTTLPVTEPLELSGALADNVPAIAQDRFVPMRLYQQDDASCLNLNRAGQPSLLGVRPEDLAVREAFVDSQNDVPGWQLLDASLDENTVPAIGDYATVYWALGKKLGDTIPYTAENGDVINLKIVAMLKDSLLQGRLFLSEDNFVRHFPSVDGYQQFLIDADWDRQDAQASALTKKYRDVGMEVVPARQKLAQFHEVENTYLAIFLVLGGLGVVLGSAALGLVLVLNVLDRQGELAMMQAVGFPKPSLARMLLLEHGVLLLGGLFCGLLPALWAVFPSIVMQGGSFPYGKVLLIAVAIVINGIVWTRIAVTAVLKSDFLQRLRNE